MAEKDWRCQQYTPLPILETVLKLIGVGVGVASLSVYANEDDLVRFDAGRIAVIVSASALMLMYVFLLVQRFVEHELIAILFSVLQVLSHICLLVISIKAIQPYDFTFTYGFLYLLGDIVKLLSCFIEKAEYEDISWFGWIGVTAIAIASVVLYLVMMGASIIILVTQFTSPNP